MTCRWSQGAEAAEVAKAAEVDGGDSGRDLSNGVSYSPLLNRWCLEHAPPEEFVKLFGRVYKPGAAASDEIMVRQDHIVLMKLNVGTSHPMVGSNHTSRRDVPFAGDLVRGSAQPRAAAARCGGPQPSCPQQCAALHMLSRMWAATYEHVGMC